MATRLGLGTLSLLAGLGAPQLSAQAWALPAADPVGIARSGAGVAFGQSLEAASLNPALLVTLKEPRSLFLAAGMEMQASMTTLQANQTILTSSDRNRFLPSLGLAWRLSPTFTLGLKADEPFMHHGITPMAATSRFEGHALDVTTHRVELQAGWAATPALSFGASFGQTQIRYAFEDVVRVQVPGQPTLAVSPTNPTLGLMEFPIRQTGSKATTSYTVGFRLAPSPRWTIAGTYVGSMKTTLDLTPSLGSGEPAYYDVKGYGAAIPGTSAFGPTVLGLTQVKAGLGTITLPGHATLGLRQRVNQIFTWEFDLRYTQGSAMVLPTLPSVTGPSGPVPSATIPGVTQRTDYRNGLGASIMGELSVSKNWTVRLGLALDSPLRPDADIDSVVGGTRTSAFSGGFGYRVWGGELNFGYQVRQSQDRETIRMDGVWAESGYRTTGSSTRIEGMGHLWSLGFKTSF